jgi:DNA-binding XRE family transcriptional regulator
MGKTSHHTPPKVDPVGTLGAIHTVSEKLLAFRPGQTNVMVAEDRNSEAPSRRLPEEFYQDQIQSRSRYLHRMLPTRPAGCGCEPRSASANRDVSSRFGTRLRSLRHARNMTQQQMSDYLGIDRTFISDVECGRKAISLPFLEVMALGFGLSLSDLFTDV